jgi:Mrp family chromosome partitioning ATPase
LPGNSRAYLVSSAAPAEGKTSLALALGLSFAASGVRTLLIDCDLVGQSLTRNLSDAKVAGLTEALVAGSMRGFVRKGKSGLKVLTVGSVAAGDACRVSRPGIERLLAEARQYFDVILIDSGPILGSVEASVVAQAVDGVVFAISRGQAQPLVDKAFRLLNSLNANVAGVVFNRAETSDFYRSAYASSSGSIATLSEGEIEVTQPRRSSRLGLLVDSVLMSLPPARIGALTNAGVGN